MDTTEDVQLEQPIPSEPVIEETPEQSTPTDMTEQILQNESLLPEEVGTPPSVTSTVYDTGPTDTDLAMLDSLTQIELLMWVVVWAIFCYIAYRLAMFLHKKIMGVVRSFIRFKL